MLSGSCSLTARKQGRARKWNFDEPSGSPQYVTGESLDLAQTSFPKMADARQLLAQALSELDALYTAMKAAVAVKPVAQPVQVSENGILCVRDVPARQPVLAFRIPESLSA